MNRITRQIGLISRQQQKHVRTAATAAQSTPRKTWSRSPASTTAKKIPATPAHPASAAAPVEAQPEGLEEPLPEIPVEYDFDPSLVESRPPARPQPSASAEHAPPPHLNAIPSSPSFPSESIIYSINSVPRNSYPSPQHVPTPYPVPAEQRQVDWVTSFHGMSAQPFSKEAAEALMRPLLAHEIEIKPDGLIYLPEIQYRRILNKAFGPGGWGLVPRSELTVMKNIVSREWGLVAGGRLVSVARGEQTYFDPSGVPTATEGCKSNALMRCCKDLGIASELWEPAFIRQFKATHCVEAWTEHSVSKKKQKRWRKKGNKFEYPYIESK
ncbi:Mgm101p-domain-containing protein [Meredithblackwellia eburnea MCA 4105]